MKKKKNILFLSKTKMGKREIILEAIHSMWTAYAILHFYLWTAFKVLVVRKNEAGMKRTNLLKLYMNYCNF